MDNLFQMVENKYESEFYPTPKSLVDKMLGKVDFKYVHTILEPSAGKGDILWQIAVMENSAGRYGKKFDIDCIETDQNLCQILKYNFSDDRKKSIYKKISNIEKCRIYDRELHEYVWQTDAQENEFAELKNELNMFFENGIHLVHDDFLTYNPFKQYDLIIMNPPFSNGDKHLLKAIDIQKDGGQIICLLNAETIRNPYTKTRKTLVDKLEEYSAEIEYIENGFVSSERETDVEIALIKVSIENAQEESEIYNRFKEAETLDEFQCDVTDLEVANYIKAAINMFNIEVKSGIELIRQYKALVPYIRKSFSENSYEEPILKLIDGSGRGYDNVSVNEYLKNVRLKYWEALLVNEKFIGKLTSKLQKKYRERVVDLSNYDFTEFNIMNLSAEMNSEIKCGIEEEAISMFDRLTEEHSYYPECRKNSYLYNGWKTNKAHKIDKKVIIPCYGIFSSWSDKPDYYNARETLEDIERVLNYFDGSMMKDVSSWSILDNNFKDGITKNIPLKYFKATFYKKGTVHLVFTCPELIERFNIYAAQKKQWLPPTYGKKAYKDMDQDERDVVDSFQGERAYNKVIDGANYYLAPITSGNVMMICS